MTQIAQAERLLPIEQPQDEVKGEEYDLCRPLYRLGGVAAKIFRNYSL